MRNLRPEGARAEEGQEAPTREEQGQEVEEISEKDQESGEVGRGLAPSEQPAQRQREFKFRYLCASGCGAVTEYKNKPVKT